MSTEIEFSKVFKKSPTFLRELEENEDFEIVEHCSFKWIIFEEVLQQYISVRQLSSKKIFCFYYLQGLDQNGIIFPKLITEIDE